MTRLPTVKECREQLFKMLEQVDGDRHHPKFVAFWKRQAEKCIDDEYQQQLFERLAEAWDELTTPEGKQEDAFSAFGVGEK